MDMSVHPFHQLFEQLGLACDDQSIAAFIKTNSPLNEQVKLADAPFWTRAQADFLREALLEDADWAEVVDALSLALRAPG
jgi:hypothetical protein